MPLYRNRATGSTVPRSDTDLDSDPRWERLPDADVLSHDPGAVLLGDLDEPALRDIAATEGVDLPDDASKDDIITVLTYADGSEPFIPGTPDGDE